MLDIRDDFGLSKIKPLKGKKAKDESIKKALESAKRHAEQIKKRK